MRVNEIDAAGPGGAQFVELLDSSVEPFPSPPYKLVVYSASGALVGKVTLPESELAATGTSPYLVANAAQGGTPDEPLTVALPATAGQVCFTRGPSEMRIHCVFYGCPVGVVYPSEGGSATTGYAGGHVWSAQRQPGGHFGPGPPTPDQPNAFLPLVPCGTPGLPIQPVVTSDRTRPVTTLGGRRRQRLSRLSVTVRVNEAATVVATGAVKVGNRRHRLRRVQRALRAGEKVRLKLKLSRKGRSSARAALALGRKVRAAVSVTATDTSGNKSVRRRNIRVTR